MVDTEQKTAQILQDCLEAIQSGDETLESALSLYPELEDELRPELENALWLMGHQALLEPDPVFVRQSRQRLIARIQAEQREAAVAPSWKDGLLSLLRMPPVMLRAAVSLVMIFILLMGADRVIETTDGAVPGDPGYSVKRTVENLTLAVSSDPGQQVVLYLEYSQRRLSEVNVLVNKNEYTAASQTLNAFEDQVRGAVSSLDGVNDGDTVHKELLAMTVQEKLADHTKQLSSLIPKVPGNTKTDVARAMMVSNDGVAVAQTAIKRLMTMRTPQPGVPQPTNTGLGALPTKVGPTPTESVILRPFPTSTEEFRQIFSSTVAPAQPTKPSNSGGNNVLPTYPVTGPTATPFPTEPPFTFPTPVPTDTPMPEPTKVPPVNTPLPPPATVEPTLSGVSTATPGTQDTGTSVSPADTPTTNVMAPSPSTPVPPPDPTQVPTPVPST